MSRYDRETALVVVDVQNDFADPGGSLYVPGGDTRVVPAVNREVKAAAAAGARVFYTQDWHPERTPPLCRGRGDLAGALRGGNTGGGVPPRPSGGGPQRA